MQTTSLSLDNLKVYEVSIKALLYYLMAWKVIGNGSLSVWFKPEEMVYKKCRLIIK